MPQRSDRRCDCCVVLATFVRYHEENCAELNFNWIPLWRNYNIGDAGAAALAEAILAPLVMPFCCAHGMQEEAMDTSASSSAKSSCDFRACIVDVVPRSVSL